MRLIGLRSLLPAHIRGWLRERVVECGIAACRRFHITHRLLRNPPGIFLDGQWYCSSACLLDALELRVSELRLLEQRYREQTHAGGMHQRRTARMPFRLILLARGSISEEQLADARDQQGNGPMQDVEAEDIGDVMVRLGYVSAADVGGARATEAGCAFYAGSAHAVPSAYRMPLCLMRRMGAVPVHYAAKHRRLLVGFLHRVDQGFLRAVEEMTGCRTEACILTGAEFRRQLDRLTAAHTYAEIEIRALELGRLAATILEQASSSHTEHIRISSSRAGTWVRLSGGPHELDLVIEELAEAPARVADRKLLPSYAGAVEALSAEQRA